MNRTARNFLAVTGIIIGSMGLAALVTGEGNAVLPASRPASTSAVTTDCDRVRSEATAASIAAVEKPAVTDPPLDQSDTHEAAVARAQARRDRLNAVRGHQEKTRHQAALYLHLVNSYAECFSSHEVASVRAILSRLATQ